MSKLEELAKICKASVSVTFNEHTTNYETVEEYLRHISDMEGSTWEEAKPDDFDEMVENNLIIDVHFYPNTPVGFYSLKGANLDKLLDEAIEIATEVTR